MKKIYFVLACLVCFACYCFGHINATTEAELKFAQLQLEQAEIFKMALKKEQEKYATKEEILIKRFKSDNDHYHDRMRQLESKLKARSDCQTITSERNRSVKLAIEGERLLKEADRIIEALK